MVAPRLARPSWRGRTNVDALTIACVEHAERIGGHEFVVTQGSYQSSVAASAGTHDLGGAVDLRWCGHDACILALRKAGMAAWHRTPAQGPWPDHVHAVVVGHPALAPSAGRQIDAYLAGRNGLANNDPDDGPRLNPIPRPVWPPHQEDDMPSPEDYAKAVWNHELNPIKGDPIRAGRILVQTHNRADVRKQLRAIEAELGDDATRAQVRKARQDIKALAEALEQESESPGA